VRVKGAVKGEREAMVSKRIRSKGRKGKPQGFLPLREGGSGEGRETYKSLESHSLWGGGKGQNSAELHDTGLLWPQLNVWAWERVYRHSRGLENGGLFLPGQRPIGLQVDMKKITGETSEESSKVKREKKYLTTLLNHKKTQKPKTKEHRLNELSVRVSSGAKKKELSLTRE